MTATWSSEQTVRWSAPTAGATTAVRPPRSHGVASMLALQRSAGNTSTMALLRRARKLTDEAPITLTLPGVVNEAVVSSWSFDRDTQGKVTAVEITRPTDADSPSLAKARTDGPPVEGRVVVRRLTPHGWVRSLTVTMADCLVDAFRVHDGYEWLRLAFSRVQVEQ
jgi:hypothetical protein